MAMEIERKWLVNNEWAEQVVLSSVKRVENIKQAYVRKTENSVLRIRAVIDRFGGEDQYGVVCVKSKPTCDLADQNVAVAQDEYEMRIPYVTAMELMRDSQFLHKSRATIQFGYSAGVREKYEGAPHTSSVTIEVDEFYSYTLGSLAGLKIAEIEFPNIEAARAFNSVHVPWFGQEVTNDKSFSNLNIAKNGSPMKKEIHLY